MSNTYTIKDWTVDEKKALQHAANAVWQEVGGDCLQAVADETGKSVDRVSVSRDEVIELALDANRPDRFLSPALRDKMQATPYRDLVKIVTPGFPYRRYGM